MSDHDDYEVGYGKPPPASRFRKGQSGNPNGRRRKAPTRSEIISRVRDQKVRIRVNGKDEAVTFFEACIWKVHNTVMASGRIADLERLLRFYERHGVAPEQERLAEAREAGEEVVRKIKEYFERTVDDSPGN